MSALFIGRFQPLHLGHLNVITQALKENDQLIIGIGSAEANFRPTNPFTCSERFQMIEAALEELKIPCEKYRIIPVRNIDNFALWIKHLELYLPPFQKIYTGSPTVRHLFQNHNAQAKNPYQIIDVKKELKISSTLVRTHMLKNSSWEEFVSPSVAKLVKKWDGISRLKAVQEAEK